MKESLEQLWSRWILIGGLFGYALFLLTIERTAPEFTYNPELTSDGAKRIADSILTDIGYDLSPFHAVARLNGDFEDVVNRKVLAEQEGTADGPGEMHMFQWMVRYWMKDQDVIQLDAGTSRQSGDTSPSITVRLDPQGSLRRLDAVLSDTIEVPSLDPEAAMERAGAFLRTYYHGRIDSLLETRSETKGTRSHYTFTWSGSDSTSAGLEIIVGVSGTFLTKYCACPRDTGKPREILSSFSLFGILSVALGTILAVLIIGTLIRRLRNDEINFRSALIWAGVSVIMLAVYYSVRYSAEDFSYTSWVFYLVIFISSAARGLIVFFAWSACEGIGRLSWNEKFLTLDAVQHLAFRSRRVGMSLVHGIAGGGLLLGLYALAHVCAALLPDSMIFLRSVTEDARGSAIFLESAVNNIASMLDLIITAVISVLVLTVFGPGLIHRLVRQSAVTILSGGVFWMLLSGTFLHLFYPVSLSLAVSFLFGALITLLFLRTDLHAVIVALIAFLMTHHGRVALHVDSGEFRILGVLVFAFLLGSLGTGYALSRLRKDEIDLRDYTPNFVKRMTERQRLQLEVESARHIQLSLLPKETPSVSRLDVASTCIPAQEVGGDYYDFISFDDHTLGVLIGDVSGKGISAAFYMTLAKGVIASQARRSHSPREVLSSVNELLYDIMERGKFISMVYGVFDTRSGNLVYAHAGHNPIIRFEAENESVSILRSRGIAIGLEKGTTFSSTLAEETITLKPDDVFVFYTDGYVEAMDKHQKEFGEESLMNALRGNHHLRAVDILSTLTTVVRSHIGRTRQHDDMTMVVVRVENGTVTASKAV